MATARPAGLGKSLTLAAVMTPRVPSAPDRSPLRS